MSTQQEVLHPTEKYRRIAVVANCHVLQLDGVTRMIAATETKPRAADWLDEALGDLKDEALIPLSKLPQVLPSLRGDRPINLSTVHRWALEGCRGHKLQCVAVASRRYTKPEWLREFFDALNAGSVADSTAPEPTPDPTPEPEQRTRAEAETDRRLASYLEPHGRKPKRRTATAK